MKEYKIYSINDPDLDVPKYIGVTTGTLKRRLYQHIYNARNKRLQISAKWIWSLLQVGKEPTINLVEICTEKNWEIREKYWIKLYRKQLYNQDPGGRGVIFKNKTSINNSTAAKFKCVYQLTESGKVIEKFENIRDATIYMGGKSKSNIGNVLKGRVNTAYGYRWCYCIDYQNYKKRIVERKTSKLGRIYVYDNSGNLIADFNSVHRTCRELFNTHTLCNSIDYAIKNNKIYRDYKFTRTPPQDCKI